MIRTDDLDRALKAWFEADAAGPAPVAALATVLDATRTRAPRPAWLVGLRGGGIDTRTRTRRWTLTRAIPAVLLLGLLVAIAIVALAVATRPSPRPTGVSNGWIAFAASPLTAGMFNGDGEHRDIYLTREGTTARRIIGAPGDGRSQGCPRFSPDGSMLAYTEGDETVGKIDLQGHTPVKNRAVLVVELGADGDASAPLLGVPLPTVPGPLPCPEWSPSGNRLAFFTGTEIWVVDVGSGVISSLPVEPTGTDDPRFPEWSSLDFEWSPDATSIAVGESGRVRVVAIDGTDRSELPVEAVATYSMGGWRLAYLPGPWEPDDTRIVDLADVGDGLHLTGVASYVVVSPDGSRLAYDTGTGPITVRDVDGSNVITLPELGSGLLWSPDAERLLSRSYWRSPDVPSELVTVEMIPGSLPVFTPFPDVSFEWMGMGHVSWQAVSR